MTDHTTTTAPHLDEAEVRRLINQIVDPCSAARGVPIGLDDMGLVCDVSVTEPTDGTGPVVDLLLRLTSPGCLFFIEFEQKVDYLLSEAGAGSVVMRWDTAFEWSPDDIRPAAQERLTLNRSERHRVIAVANS